MHGAWQESLHVLYVLQVFLILPFCVDVMLRRGGVVWYHPALSRKVAMERINIFEKAGFSDAKMKKVPLFSSERFACDLYCLQPGQSQKPHAHEGMDKVYVTLEGEGIVQIGEETAPLGACQAVHAGSNVVHGIENRGTQQLVVLTFLAPHP